MYLWKEEMTAQGFRSLSHWCKTHESSLQTSHCWLLQPWGEWIRWKIRFSFFPSLLVILPYKKKRLIWLLLNINVERIIKQPPQVIKKVKFPPVFSQWIMKKNVGSCASLIVKNVILIGDTVINKWFIKCGLKVVTNTSD